MFTSNKENHYHYLTVKSCEGIVTLSSAETGESDSSFSELNEDDSIVVDCLGMIFGALNFRRA